MGNEGHPHVYMLPRIITRQMRTPSPIMKGQDIGHLGAGARGEEPDTDQAYGDESQIKV